MVDTGITFIARSNALESANYFASGTGEDNAGNETTGFSTSADENAKLIKNHHFYESVMC